MRQLSVIVYKDQTSSYPNGCARVIPADCTVLGMDATVFTQIFPEDRCGGQVTAPQTFLKLKDAAGHLYWVQETVSSWGIKVNGIECCASSGTETLPITLQGDIDVPAGDTITSPQLFNLAGRIATITLGGIAIYNVPYTTDGISTGTLNLTAYGGLGTGQFIQITLKF